MNQPELLLTPSHSWMLFFMNTPDLFQNVGLTSQKLVIYLRSEGGKIEKDQTAVAETS